MNNIKLTGNVGNEIVIRDLGTSRLIRFSIAVNSSRAGTNDPKQPSWHKVVAFGKAADECEALLSKGKFISVEGKLQNRKYLNDQNKMTQYTEIVAFKVKELVSTTGFSA